MKNQNLINKSMYRGDLKSPEAVEIIGELNALVMLLKKENLDISSWYGTFRLSGDDILLETINRGYGYKKIVNSVDDNLFPWFLYWEIVWVVLNGEFQAGQKILDLGGSSSLFSYYLASKGCDVVTVDLTEDLVENGNFVADQMNWKLKNYVMDINDLRLSEEFDHVTSICVFEHIPLFQRIEINKKIKNLLKQGGRFSITFDYLNPSKKAQIDSPQNVYKQFVESSGLKIRGNSSFYDNGERYLLHPFFSENTPEKYKTGWIKAGHFEANELGENKTCNDYTFGALFQENY